jgi:hypothetical protein
MNRIRLAALGWVFAALGATAQTVTDPDWKETQTPAPPAFNVNLLIPIEMPSYVSLRFGVDPATLSITPDGIVRYVVIATSTTGATSAMYEGLRCATGEVKTYARYGASGPWSLNTDPQWQDWNGNLPSKHALALARQGLCDGRSTAASSVPAIIRALKNVNPHPF